MWKIKVISISFCPQNQNENKCPIFLSIILLSESRLVPHLSIFSVVLNPMEAFELLFFAVFGQTTPEDLRIVPNLDQPVWTLILYKIELGVYMLVSVVVLINLLIAMMSDTYQRIQVIHVYEINGPLCK